MMTVLFSACIRDTVCGVWKIIIRVYSLRSLVDRKKCADFIEGELWFISTRTMVII